MADGLAPDLQPNGSAPKQTLEGARDLVRSWRVSSGGINAPVVVALRGGVHRRQSAFELRPEDGGSSAFPVTYQAWKDEKPTITGLLAISGWTVGPQGWTVTLPQNHRRIRSVWVEGERVRPMRRPRQGLFEVEVGGAPPEAVLQGFAFDLNPSWDLTESWAEILISFIATPHTISSYQPTLRQLTLSPPSVASLHPSATSPARYALFNVKGESPGPGEWNLGRSTGVLTYVPRPGDQPHALQVEYATTERLLSLLGNPAGQQFVEHVRFRGISFAGTEWDPPPETAQNCVQAGVSDRGLGDCMPAAIHLLGARDVLFEDVEVRKTGAYGLWLRRGTQRVEVNRGYFADLGGGAIRIGEASRSDPTPAYDEVGHHLVRNSIITGGNQTHLGAVGIWVGHSSYNRILNNDISDLAYSGISAGWQWIDLWQPSAVDNEIAFNRIHHLGRDLGDDFAGIYLLGQTQQAGSPGTRVHHNVVHDIEGHGPLCMGLYADQSSAHVRLDHNVVFNVRGAGFHVNAGDNLSVDNNLLAFSRHHSVSTNAQWVMGSTTLSFSNNLVLTTSGMPWNLAAGVNVASQSNLYWDPFGPVNIFSARTWSAWQNAGYDVNSVIGDPLLADPLALDFSPTSASAPILTQVGFEPWDTQTAGVQGDPAWRQRVPVLTPASAPQPGVHWRDDFENQGPGTRSRLARSYDGPCGWTAIRTAPRPEGLGGQALHVTGCYLSYDGAIPRGTVTEEFDLRLDGAGLGHEWRDATSPYVVGPRLTASTDGWLRTTQGNLLQAPTGVWVHVILVYALGSSAYSATASYLAQGTPVVAQHAQAPLPNPQDAPLGITWIGTWHQGSGGFWLDNVDVRSVP